MGIQFAGPKPIISHHGISFDNNKIDKYEYLDVVVQLLKALDHDYFEDKTYIYNAEIAHLSESQLNDELRRYCPDIDSLMETQNHTMESEFEHELARAHENTLLSEDEKEAWLNNLEIMHDYLIQRSINKRVYYCAVDRLAQLLQHDHIEHIVTPGLINYIHVLHSLEGSIQRQHLPIDTKLVVYEEDERLFAKLQVITIK
ncbi:MAG: hypothetical protein IE916_07220 [Epsilonproteobacteria bacterium]|nr:hypothetical protein [Campylobacterota bacterium]